MPKSKERLGIEATLKNLVPTHGGKILYEMNQMDFKENWDLYTGGMCNGISILWLRHQHNDIQAKAFPKVLDMRYREMRDRIKSIVGAEKEKELRKWSTGETLSVDYDDVQKRRDDPFTKVMNKMHVNGQVNPLYDKEAEFNRVKEIMRSYDMEFKDSDLFAGGFWHGHTDLGKFVGEKGTASLLHAPKHAMAACNVLGKPTFFDPNFGCFEFMSASKMGAFLSAYFKISHLNRIYSGSEGQKKLAVKADRYKYTVTRTYDLTRR